MSILSSANSANYYILAIKPSGNSSSFLLVTVIIYCCFTEFAIIFSTASPANWFKATESVANYRILRALVFISLPYKKSPMDDIADFNGSPITGKNEAIVDKISALVSLVSSTNWPLLIIFAVSKLSVIVPTKAS